MLNQFTIGPRLPDRALALGAASPLTSTKNDPARSIHDKDCFGFLAHDLDLGADMRIHSFPTSAKRQASAAPTSDCRGGSARARPHVKAVQIDANDSAR